MTMKAEAEGEGVKVYQVGDIVKLGGRPMGLTTFATCL